MVTFVPWRTVFFTAYNHISNISRRVFSFLKKKEKKQVKNLLKIYIKSMLAFVASFLKIPKTIRKDDGRNKTETEYFNTSQKCRRLEGTTKVF